MTISNWNSMMHSYRRILHPTDLTARDAFPFQISRALARGLNAELVVVHATPVRDLQHVVGYRAGIEHKLKLMRHSDPNLKITTHLFGGDPVSEIVGWANETLCDAIVMRRSQEKWLVGRLIASISQRVKKLVRCPVIAIGGRPAHSLIKDEWAEDFSRVIKPVKRTALNLS